MRKIIWILFMGMNALAFGQNITSVTIDIYQDNVLVDTQVFDGFTPSSNIDEEISISTSGLNDGIHTFILTVTDENGVSSIHEKGVFLHETQVLSQAQVTDLEYFFDDDPGSGGATTILTSPSDEVITTSTLNTSGLTIGFHTLHLRARDQNQLWGPYSTATIFVSSNVGFNDVVQIESLEYFIDLDPGAGNGSPIMISTSDNVSLTESIDLTGIEPGFHTLFVRGKLENGTWGPYTSKTILVESVVGLADAVVIEELEYFLDLDPGAGNGTSIVVSPTNEVSLIESIDLSSATPGFHTLYLRGKLENGTWGNYQPQTILIESSVGLADVVVVGDLEYFIDSDPGLGAGTPISLTPSSVQELNENIDLSGLSEGFHTLYLRGKLENGSWGSYQSATILVEKQNNLNQITAIEYFFDTDPGTGNATQVAETFPVNSFAETVNLATSSLPSGSHKISVRAKDDQGRWGNYLTQEIEVLSPDLNESIAAGNWNDASTWSRGLVPSDNDSVVVKHAIDLDLLNTSVFALTLTTGSNLSLNGNEIHIKGRFKKESAGILTPENGVVFMDGGTQTYQHEGDITFDRLVFAGTGTKILDYASGDELIIADSIGIATGLLIDFPKENEIRLTENALFNNLGTITSNAKWSLIIAGTSHLIIGGDFKNVTFTSVATVSLGGNFTYRGSFSSPGTGITFDINEYVLSMGTLWNFDSNDNLSFESTGLLMANHEMNFSSGVDLPDLFVNTTSNTFTTSTSLTFANNRFLTLTSGVMEGNSMTFSGTGGINLSGGQLNLTNHVISFGNGGAINNNGGDLSMDGSSSTLQGTAPTDQFSITQVSGSISLSEVRLSGTGSNGLFLIGGSASLNNLTFENGFGDSYLTFGNGFDGQTYVGFTFSNGPTHNVSILDDIEQTISFDQYQGEFGGPDFDNPGSLGTINWTNEVITDETPPVITVTEVSTQDLSPSLSGTIDDNDATVVITINDVDYTDITINEGIWSVTSGIIGPLEVGTYDVVATATDLSGNLGSDASTDELIILPSPTVAQEASNVGTTTFTANWTSVDGGVSHYLLDVSPDAEFSTFLDGFQDAVVGTTESTLTDLASNTTYFYRVRVAFNSGDISVYSSTIEVTTLEEDVIAPVVTINETSSQDLSPALDGTIDDDLATIVITINDVEYSDVSIDGGIWTISNGIIGPLEVGTYDVAATATDLSGNIGSDASTDELIILPSPTVAQEASNVGTSTFTANWTSVDGGVSHYLLDVSTDIEFTTFLDGFQDTVIEGTESTLTDLTSNTTYFYRVRVAFNSGDISANSSTIEVTTLEEDVIAPVVTINETSSQDLSPALGGTIDDDLATIVITINDVEYSVVSIDGGVWTISNGIVGPLEVGTYNVIATATDLSGNVGNDATTDELVILPSPTVAQEATNIGTTTFTANWTSVDGGVSHYLLDVSTDIEFTTFLDGFQNAVVDGTERTLTDLASITTYFYRVRVAFNSGDISDYSNAIEVKTDPIIFDTNDSLALVQIYADLDGENWTINDNWLSGRLNTWHGVEIEETRVKAINLSNNNLSGDLSRIEEGLGEVSMLNISQNNVTSIAGFGELSSTSSINVSDNILQFGSLETLVALSENVNYADQANSLSSLTIAEEIGESVIIDRTVSGSNNIYQWFKNDTEITNEGGTLSIESANSDDSGDYFVTVTNTTVPELILRSNPVTLRVLSLERDRNALLAIYDALDGENWSNNADWPNRDQNDLNSWPGIRVANDRVVEISLGGFNLSGEVPEDINDLSGVTIIDFSENEVTKLPDMRSMTQLLQFNVSQNLLDFGDLEPNVNITGINYQNQKPFGPVDEEVNRNLGSNYTIETTIGGSANQYQWSASGPVINGIIQGANDASYEVADIRYANMGDYVATVTSDLVPDLTLSSNPVTINATTSMRINPTYFDIDDESTLLDEGIIQLLQVVAPGAPYDSTNALIIEEQGYEFEEVILGDYLIGIRTDTLFLRDKGGRTDSVRLLPTYFQNTFLWEDADTLLLRDRIAIDVSMQALPDPLRAGDGDGMVALIVESDFQDDNEKSTESRIEARRKVKRAGCSLRRRRRAGGGRIEDDEFELVVYKETDENGQVTFENLPDGTYRLNIEYPGIPMDPNSFVEFEVGAGGIEDNELTLEATVSENGIVVELVEFLGFYRKYFKELELYPNPANRELNIRYEKLVADEVRLQLIDLKGQVLIEQSVPEGNRQIITLDITEQKEGIYLLRFMDPKAREVTILTYRVLISR